MKIYGWALITLPNNFDRVEDRQNDLCAVISLIITFLLFEEKAGTVVTVATTAAVTDAAKKTYFKIIKILFFCRNQTVNTEIIRWLFALSFRFYFLSRRMHDRSLRTRSMQTWRKMLAIRSRCHLSVPIGIRWRFVRNATRFAGEKCVPILIRIWFFRLQWFSNRFAFGGILCRFGRQVKLCTRRQCIQFKVVMKYSDEYFTNGSVNAGGIHVPPPNMNASSWIWSYCCRWHTGRWSHAVSYQSVFVAYAMPFVSQTKVTTDGCTLCYI